MYYIIDRIFKTVLLTAGFVILLITYTSLRSIKYYAQTIQDKSRHRTIKRLTDLRQKEKIDSFFRSILFPKKHINNHINYSRLHGMDKAGNNKKVLGDKRFREVALTFDIGNLSAGKYILDILKKYNVKATFFLANNKSFKVKSYSNGKPIYYRTLEKNKNTKDLAKLILRMHEEGHQVGNHTWSHHNWIKSIDVLDKKIKLSKKLFINEMDMVNKRYKEITGVNLSPVWRSPFGACDPKIIRWAKEIGYDHISWTSGLDSLDWTDYYSSNSTLDFLKKKTKAGIVYLFHLGNFLRKRNDKIHEILPELITWLKKQNYHPVTIDRLLDGRNNKKKMPPA